MLHFLAHGKDDNVAVAVVEVKAGEVGQCLNMKTDQQSEIKAITDVPLGHKIALSDLQDGDAIVKYDHDIGRVVQNIQMGEHVHVHNVKTRRW